VSSGFGTHLPDRKGSGAAMCTVALDPASLQGTRESIGVPCALRLQILPPCKGGLQCATCPAAPDPASVQGRALMCHVSYNSRSCLSVGVSSDAPRVLQLQILPPYRGGLRSTRVSCGFRFRLPVGRAPGCHASCGPLWAVSHKHKEKPSMPTCAAKPTCSQHMHTYFKSA
jgi:hypothetical protein